MSRFRILFSLAASPCWRPPSRLRRRRQRRQQQRGPPEGPRPDLLARSADRERRHRRHPRREHRGPRPERQFQGRPVRSDRRPRAGVPEVRPDGHSDGDAGGSNIDFEGGATSTGDAAYVSYKGTDYQVPASIFSYITNAYTAGQQQQSQQSQQQTLPQLKESLTNVKNEGTEDVDGTETVHVSGDIDVNKLVDVVSVRPAGAGARRPGASALPSPQELDQLKQLVTGASFDVFSGADDHVLRRLDFNLELQEPGGSGKATFALPSPSARSMSRRRSRRRAIRSPCRTCSTSWGSATWGRSASAAWAGRAAPAARRAAPARSSVCSRRRRSRSCSSAFSEPAALADRGGPGAGARRYRCGRCERLGPSGAACSGLARQLQRQGVLADPDRQGPDLERAPHMHRRRGEAVAADLPRAAAGGRYVTVECQTRVKFGPGRIDTVVRHSCAKGVVRPFRTRSFLFLKDVSGQTAHGKAVGPAGLSAALQLARSPHRLAPR